MSDDPEVIVSPLSRRFTKDGITVEVSIYRLEDSLWSLEVIDGDNNSIVWDDEFQSDDDALREFMTTIETEGLDGVLRDPDQPN